MTLRNNLQALIKTKQVGAEAWRDAMSVTLRLIAPIMPHMTEELWERLGFGYSIHQQDWPVFAAEKAKEDLVSLVIMVNGKPRAEVKVSPDIEQAEAVQLALASEDAQRFYNGGTVKKTVFIPSRGGMEPKVNIVV
jgi:leucyl-tRNA synthetase